MTSPSAARQIGNPDGPLGSRYGKKLNVYRDVFATPKWRNDIHVLARRSIRDHERFLNHFDQVSEPSTGVLFLS